MLFETTSLADQIEHMKTMYHEVWFSTGFSYAVDEETKEVEFPDVYARQFFFAGIQSGKDYLKHCEEELVHDDGC